MKEEMQQALKAFEQKNPELFQALHRPELGLEEIINQKKGILYEDLKFEFKHIHSNIYLMRCNILHITSFVGNPQALRIVLDQMEQDGKINQFINSEVISDRIYIGTSTPLMMAMINRHEEAVKVLIDKSADIIYKPRPEYSSVLEEAAKMSDIKLLEVLTKKINDKFLYTSSLNVSIEYCNIKSINFLLDKGAIATNDSLNLALARNLDASKAVLCGMRNGVRELLTLLNSGVIIQEDHFQKLKGKIDTLYQPRLITEEGLCPIVCLGGMVRIFKWADQFKSETVKSAIKNYIFDAGLNDLVHEKVERVKQSKDPLETKQFIKSINTLLKNISENLGIFKELKESYLQLHEKASDILFSSLEGIKSSSKEPGVYKALADTLKRTVELYEWGELKDRPDLLQKLSNNLEVCQKIIIDHLSDHKDEITKQSPSEHWLISYVKDIFYLKTNDVSSKVEITDTDTKREIVKYLPLDLQGRLGNLCKDSINAPWLPECLEEGNSAPADCQDVDSQKDCSAILGCIIC